MDNMDLKRSTGKSFPSVHISDMHEIRMYRNTEYYNIQLILSDLKQTNACFRKRNKILMNKASRNKRCLRCFLSS